MQSRPALASFACTLLLLAATGCNAHARFQVSVRNDGQQPVTVGFVKSGPPAERDWLTPDQLAILTSDNGGNPPRWGMVVPPGRTATANLDGHFARDVIGFLRVYRGEHSLSELMAMGPKDPDRADLPLDEGFNEFVVDDRTGRLTARDLTPPRRKR